MGVELALIVDHRERAVADCLVRQQEQEDEKREQKTSLQLRVAALDLGDFQIVEHEFIEQEEQKEEEETMKTRPRVIFERKTLADMCASIKDGRYREQKARIFGSGLVDNNKEGARVVYILEGCASYDRDLRRVSVENGLNSSTLQSCVHNLMFRDGIFVVFATDVQDTASFLRETWKRYRQQSSRTATARNNGVAVGATSNNSDAITSALVGAAAHAKRNRNITHRTCFLMQLCQFPGVSEKTALAISDKWGSMQRLYADLSSLSEKERVDAFSSIPGIGKVNARKFVEFAFPESEETEFK